MKTLFVIIISLVIFLFALMGDLPRECTFHFIKRDVPLQMFEAITRDGHQNPKITRFFHNKPGFYSQNILRCYLSYFDVSYLLKALSPFGLVFLLTGLFILINIRKLSFNFKILILFLAFAPIPAFFALNELISKFFLFGPISMVSYLGLSKILDLKNIKHNLLIGILFLISVVYFLK